MVDNSEKDFSVVFVPADGNEPLQTVKVHQPKDEAIGCLINHCKRHFAKRALTPEQTKVFQNQVKEHAAKQNQNPDDFSSDVLQHMASITTCDVIALHPNIPDTGHIAVNMYVDDKGVAKQLEINRRASSIAAACGKQVEVIGDAFIAKQFDDGEGFERFDFTVDDLDGPWVKRAQELNTRSLLAQSQGRLEQTIENLGKSNPAKAKAGSERSQKVYREKQKGNQCFRRQDYETAVEHYTKALQLVDHADANFQDRSIRPALYSNRSACYTKLKQFDNALNDSMSCIQCKPDWAKGWGRRADALGGLGKYDQALAAIDKALELAPDTEDFLVRKKEWQSMQDSKPF